MSRRDVRAAIAKLRGTRHEWHPFEIVLVDAAKIARLHASIGDLRQCWRNNVYAVQVYARSGPGALHLAIRRHDGKEICGWSDLQRVKNEIAGPEQVAVEVYPAASRLVDEANMRHLFVLPAGEAEPFTIEGRWS